MKNKAFTFGNNGSAFGQNTLFDTDEQFSGGTGWLNIGLQNVGWQNGGGQNGGGQGGRGPGSAPKQEPVTDPGGDAGYSEEAIAEMVFMLEEEKLAGDIYEAFYEAYGLKIFDKIGDAEDAHFDAVSDYATKIGVNVDEFVFQPAGEFVNPELLELYDTLLAQGMASVTDALEVGVIIEEKDIVDISAASDAVEGTALANIYDNLLAGSYNHLDAFEGLLG